MNTVFLVDSYSRWDIEKDTSFALMLNASARGHTILLLHEGGLTGKNGDLYFQLTKVMPQRDRIKPFTDSTSITLKQNEIDLVFIRTDPPFDQDYLMQTWLLDLLPLTVPVINKPSGIRTANEKIWAMQFELVIPRTMISRNRETLLQFISEEKKAVLKPTDGFGGRGIEIIEENQGKVINALEKATKFWRQEVILQEHIPQAVKGDKRILLLNGEPLGAVLRVHSANDFRNNFMAGGKPHTTTITANDRKIIELIKPRLIEQGLYFVGIDIIGDYLTEINVTSPTCLQEINRLYNLSIDNQVLDFAEKLVDQACEAHKIST